MCLVTILKSDAPTATADSTYSSRFICRVCALARRAYGRPEDDRERDDDVVYPMPEQGGDHQRQDQKRERQEHVRDPHEALVEHPTPIACDDPYRRAEGGGYEEDGYRHLHVHLRTIDHPAQYIPPQIVRTHKMNPRRGLLGDADLHRIGVVPV